MKNQEIYLRFLSLLHAIEGNGQVPALDLDANRIVAMSHIASPATIHRKLDQLREAGMVDSHYEGSNRRTKYLKPTEKAQMYFSTVGGLMQQASQTAI